MPRKKNKEVWAGAGLALDWEEIRADDFKKVEQWLRAFADTDERLTNLLNLRTRFEYECEKIAIRLRSLVTGGPMDYHYKGEADSYSAHMKGFGGLLKHEIAHLQKLLSVERKPAAPPSIDAKAEPALAGDVGDDPALGKWTNLPTAVALCALLRAAEMPAGISDRAVGRFAKLLTGRSDGKMATEYHNAVFGAFTDDHAEIVANALIELGLDKAAADVRKKFQKDGI
jgi:hypothetical protein